MHEENNHNTNETVTNITVVTPIVNDPIIRMHNTHTVDSESAADRVRRNGGLDSLGGNVLLTDD
jgi:hypothetical protein